MNIINNKTVSVSTSNELKQALEEDNGYTYIYLESNITLESTITINPNKQAITIDGTYQNIRHTYTTMTSNEKTDIIVVSKTNRIITVKNIDIIGSHTYGVMYVEQSTLFKDILVEYNNITYTGAELSFNPYGTTKIIDATITIEDKNGITCGEVCDSDHVIIGGTTNITSAAVNCSVFYYLNNTNKPSLIFLPNSRVNITSDTKDLTNGTNKLDFQVLHDAEVNVITGNGFSALTVAGVLDVLIDKRATFNFIENKHQRIPMWSVFGNLTINEGANVYILNTYESTPSDNYNIHFKGTNKKITINNPNSIILYTKNANVIYTNNDIEFSFTMSRINMWETAVTFNSAGNLTNMPDYSWYKENGLIEMTGTISKNTTTITSSNLTEEEKRMLPDLTNFAFQNRKQLSIGTSRINIHPITNSTISGHTQSDAEVLIKYNDVETTVTPDQEGLFTYNLPSMLPDDTTVEIISNIPGSFIYKTRKITTPYNGEITIMETNDNIVFDLVPIVEEGLIFPKTKEVSIKIIDSRLNSSDWELYLHLTEPLTSQNNYTLPGALMFKKLDDTTTPLNEVPTLIFTGANNEGNIELQTITWSKEKGPLLSLINNYLVANEEYNTTMIWSIKE